MLLNSHHISYASLVGLVNMAKITQLMPRFVLPDLAISAERSALLPYLPAMDFALEIIELHDCRKDLAVIKQPSDLDTQGFTVNHKSALFGSQ